jgi:hypothetical protein
VVSQSAKTAIWQGALSSPASLAERIARRALGPGRRAPLRCRPRNSAGPLHDATDHRPGRTAKAGSAPPMARDKPVRAPPRPSPVVADRGETGVHHAARLVTRATGRGKRHRMQARTASRLRSNGYQHNQGVDVGRESRAANRVGLQLGIAGPIGTHVSCPLGSHPPVALTAWSLLPRNRHPDRRTSGASAIEDRCVGTIPLGRLGGIPVRLDRRN